MNHILDLYREDFSDIQTDVNNGFSQNNKSIPAKYHYDEKGSELFNQITHHLDYYLTSCEMNALFRHTHRLLDIFQSSSFNLIELGPGEGIKTDLMMSSFLNASMHFRYIPIDLSYVYLNHMISKLKLVSQSFCKIRKV